MVTPFCKTFVISAPAYNLGCSPNSIGRKLTPVSPGLCRPARFWSCRQPPRCVPFFSSWSDCCSLNMTHPSCPSLPGLSSRAPFSLYVPRESFLPLPGWHKPQPRVHLARLSLNLLRRVCWAIRPQEQHGAGHCGGPLF